VGDHQLSRRNVLKGLSTVAAAAGLPKQTAQAHGTQTTGTEESGARRPNIFFFCGEGLRHDAFGFAGNSIVQTPNFDRLAREGVTFKNAFTTNALCLPSRGSLLTGAWSHATGAVTNGDHGIPAHFPIISDVLRDAGYEVAFIGKPHVKGALLERHWDYYFAFPGQADYYNPQIVEGRDGQYGPPTRYPGYVDDILTDKTVNWLSTRKTDKPFCLFLWVYAPHEPFYRPRRMADRFNGVYVPKPHNFDEDLAGYPGKPRAVANADNKIVTSSVATDDPRSLEEVVKDYYVGVEANDENLGRVLKTLAARNQLDDTAVVVSSDHGFFLGEHTFYDKRLMYEPSIRVPMTIRYPRRVAPGTSREEMVLNVDIAPTIFDIAGVESPATVQGRSFYPLALGQAQSDWRQDWLYEYYEYPGWENVRPSRGVRTERYKYIHYFLDPEEFELYDLQEDPAEDHNLYGKPEYAALTARLKSRLKELRRETDDHYVYHPATVLKMIFVPVEHGQAQCGPVPVGNGTPQPGK
jgi:arylsulfatase A-like enzyme